MYEAATTWFFILSSRASHFSGLANLSTLRECSVSVSLRSGSNASLSMSASSGSNSDPMEISDRHPVELAEGETSPGSLSLSGIQSVASQCCGNDVDAEGESTLVSFPLSFASCLGSGRLSSGWVILAVFCRASIHLPRTSLTRTYTTSSAESNSVRLAWPVGITWVSYSASVAGSLVSVWYAAYPSEN